MRIPPFRRSVPLLLGVFLVGLGIGALIIALSDHGNARQLIITRQVVSASRPVRTASTSTSPAKPRVAKPRSQARRDPRYGSTVLPSAAASFGGLESQLGGSVGLAVAPLGAGPIVRFGPAQIAHAWSTSKVPVLVTLLSTYENLDRMLSPQGQTDATLALTESDNAAIEALFSALEQLDGGLVPASAAVQQMFRRAGDATAIVNTAPNNDGFTTYGQSEWSLRDEIIFYRALARGCLLAPRDTRYVLGLMKDVIPSQRWGAGSAGYPGTIPLSFKGGWGPDSSGNYQVRQTAIVGSGNRGYVFTMLALPPGGSFAQGTSMLSALATWARQHFVLSARRPPGTCASAP